MTWTVPGYCTVHTRWLNCATFMWSLQLRDPGKCQLFTIFGLGVAENLYGSGLNFSFWGFRILANILIILVYYCIVYIYIYINIYNNSCEVLQRQTVSRDFVEFFPHDSNPFRLLINRLKPILQRIRDTITTNDSALYSTVRSCAGITIVFYSLSCLF